LLKKVYGILKIELEEAIKYCNLDCITLHEVLTKFNSNIFKFLEYNIKYYPTLPSLSFQLKNQKSTKLKIIYTRSMDNYIRI